MIVGDDNVFSIVSSVLFKQNENQKMVLSFFRYYLLSSLLNVLIHPYNVIKVYEPEEIIQLDPCLTHYY